jgi:hypothetical protein
MDAPRLRLESLRPLALLLFACLGFYLVRGATGSPSTNWMLIYEPSDFPTVTSLVDYLADLRIPIPPILSSLEIIDHQLTGSTRFVTVYLYRLGFVAGYLIAIQLASSTLPRLGLSFSMSGVLLAGSVLVHRANPQVYDVLLPCLLLLFVFSLERARNRGEGDSLALGFCALAGFSLSMAELLRPFMIFVLPVALVCAFAALRRLPRRCALAFLVPILLFSGMWHIHVAHAHGQLTWSNHSGFNLRLSQLLPPESVPPLEMEHAERLGPGRWPNLNSEIHTQNSRKIQSAVVGYMIRHPVDGTVRLARAFWKLVATPTKVHIHDPARPRHGPFRVFLLGGYRLVSIAGAIFLIANAARLAWLLIRSRERRLDLLAVPDNIVILLGVMLLMFLSIGAGREQGRIILSLLPLYAVLPVARRWTPEPERAAGGGADS